MDATNPRPRASVGIVQGLAWSATQDGVAGDTPTLAELRWQAQTAINQGCSDLWWFGPHTWYDTRDGYGYARVGAESQPAATPATFKLGTGRYNGGWCLDHVRLPGQP